MTPCAVGNIQFRLALPEPDELQISIVGEDTFFYLHFLFVLLFINVFNMDWFELDISVCIQKHI